MKFFTHHACAHLQHSHRRPPPLSTLLREARRRCGLTQEALARSAGLSLSTIKNLERGRPASLTSLRCLLAVRGIELPEELRLHLAADPEGLNAWLAPGFSPLSFFRHMLAVLRGRGGLVEQSYLYFDHQSAVDWSAIASQDQYHEAHRALPLDRAARAVASAIRAGSAQGRAADVIALGPGDGRLETRFVACLAELLPHPAIRFYLLDISQPLLCDAYRHASAVLGPSEGITPIAILGDFHCLPQYGQLSYESPAAPRRKVVLLLGGTLGNLESEHRFLQGSLRGFPPGTLLLLDYPCPFAPAAEPDAVRARDPWLTGGGAGLAWRERVLQFWTGPLRRYVPGCTAVEVRLDLAPPAAGSLPGGYAVEATARTAVRGEPAREFSIFRLKRYEPLGLARALRDLGWDPLDGWPYGGDAGYPRALSLFVRRGA